VSSGVTTYPTVIRLNDTVEGLLPNMSASASIITQVKDNALIVPSSSIQTTNGQSTIQIMKDGKPQQVQIETGISSGTQTEISAGVSEGDTIVTRTITATSGSATSNTATSPFSALGGNRTNRAFGAGGATFIAR
jgi:multidrug efflux pump subunit AcrA (membrane-fusion protein)